MAQNGSFSLKKPSMPVRRPFLHLNLPDVNSTMTPDKTMTDPTKWPKRKSCLMYQDKKLLQPSIAMKKMKSDIPKAEFRSRTLKMVQGRTSLAPPRPPTRQSRYIPAPSSTSNSAPAPAPAPPARPFVLQAAKQRLPLHMSTPCDPPRSILKAVSPKVRVLSAAKKVNFDNLPDEGICPLEDLTIQDIPKLELKKITKVDAGTNTEPDMSASAEIVSTGEDAALKSFMISIESRLSSIENTLQLLVNNNRSNHTAILLESQVKTVHKFMSNLDDIREDRESITPSLQEKTETPSNLQATDTVTPGAEVSNTDATPFLTRVSPKQTVSLAPEVLEEEEEEKEDSEKEVSVVLETSPVSDGPKRRSTRSQSTEVTLQATKMEGSKQRNIRKRGVPRYLESFELSPKPTKPKTRRDRD